MSEPAALTRSREQALIEVWGQCASVFVDVDEGFRVLWRCASGRLEAHHKDGDQALGTRKSGRGHSPEGIVPWCLECHQLIYHSGKRKGPTKDKQGREYWTQDIGDRSEVRIVRVYDWRELAPELEERFQYAGELMRVGATWGKKGQWCIGWAWEEMSRLALWQMDSDLTERDTSFGDYLRNRGVRIEDKTLLQQCNVAGTLKAKGITIEELLETVDECAAVHQFPAGYASVRDSLPAVRQMDKPQILTLLSSTPSSDFNDAIHDQLEGAANDAAAERGETRVQMDCTLTVGISHTMTSVGSKKEDQRKLEGRIRQAIGKRGVPGSYRFKHHSRREVNPGE